VNYPYLGISYFAVIDVKTIEAAVCYCMYVKVYIQLNVEYSPAVDFKDNVWCQIGELFVGVCYRSANYSIVGDQNNDKLLHLLNVMREKHTLIMGDFNYPEIDWSSCTVDASASSDCKGFLESVEDCFYTQHVKDPTRVNAVLDLVLTHKPDLVSEVSINDRLGASDHNNVVIQTSSQ